MRAAKYTHGGLHVRKAFEGSAVQINLPKGTAGLRAEVLAIHESTLTMRTDVPVQSVLSGWHRSAPAGPWIAHTPGLCIALVPQRDGVNVALACQELQRAMRRRHAPSGVLVVNRAARPLLERPWSSDDLLDWANHGVGVIEVETDDLQAVAEQYMSRFAEHRQAMRARFFQANSISED